MITDSLMTSVPGIEKGDWNGLLWFLSIALLAGIVLPIIPTIKRFIESKLVTDIASDTMKYRTELSQQMKDITELIAGLKEEFRASKRPGEVSNETEVIRLIHKHFDCINTKLYSYFCERVFHNHIDTQRDDISIDYSQYGEDTASRLHGFLKHYTFNGKCLADFFSSGGANRYVLYIVNELFMIQCHAFDMKKTVPLHRVEAGIQRCTSILLSQFKIYLSDGHSFLEQWDDSNPQYTILKPLNGVEIL